MQQNFDVNMRKRTHTYAVHIPPKTNVIPCERRDTARAHTETERVGISMEAAEGIVDHCSSYAFDVVYSFNQNQPQKHFVQ